MAEARQQYRVGDQLILKDLNTAPEGSWVIRETGQFLRAVDGRSITSITPIEGCALPTQKMPERFTLVYAGHPQVEKSVAVFEALNYL